MGILLSRSHLHDENNGLQICSLRFAICTDLLNSSYRAKYLESSCLRIYEQYI